MYTFRRPQQKQQQQQSLLAGGSSSNYNNNNNNNNIEGAADVTTINTTYTTLPGEFRPDVGDVVVMPPHDSNEYTDGRDAATQQQQQQGEGKEEKIMSPESVLVTCRNIIHDSQIVPPPEWRRVRKVLPASIAELKLTPSAPEVIQQENNNNNNNNNNKSHVSPSPCVVIQLDNTVPPEMTQREYCKGLVKYVMDLLVYKRTSTAITSLRFVKIGAELSQLVITFGRDVGLASMLLHEFQAVGLRAGFGAPVKKLKPSATFRVTDYYATLNGGSGITADDISALLSSGRPDEINVVAGYEPGVFYACMQRTETVYAWLCNPFCSFKVQHTLFEHCGVLLTMADCPHTFIVEKGNVKENNNNNNNNNNSGSENERVAGSDAEDDGMDDDDNNNYYDETNNNNDSDNRDDVYGGRVRGDRGGRKSLPEWSRHAKDEIDIFEGLDRPARVQTATAMSFVDDDEITEIFHRENTEKTQTQEEKEQKEEKPNVYTNVMQAQRGGALYETPTVVVGVKPMNTYGETELLPAQPQQFMYFGNTSLPPPWQQQQQQQQQYQQQQQSIYEPQLSLGANVSSLPYSTVPPPTDEGTYMHASEGRNKIKYPELVDEDTNSNHGYEGNINEEAFDVKARMPREHPALYWNAGGNAAVPVVGGSNALMYPGMTINSPYMPHSFPSPLPMQIPQMPPQVINNEMNFMPSILGQSVNTIPYNVTEFPSETESNNNNNNNNLGILATPFSPMAEVTQPIPCVMTVEKAHELSSRLVEINGKLVLTSSSETTEEKEENNEEEEDTLFRRTPCHAATPSIHDDEMQEFITFVKDHYIEIMKVIKSSSPEMQESCMRITSSLLVSPWTLLEEKKDADVNDTHQEKTMSNNTKLHSLLPYLLTIPEGIEIVSCIAASSSSSYLPTRKHLLSLLPECILPFLLDSNVVRSVCAVALHADPTAENPIVKRIIRHWGLLTKWLHRYIHNPSSSPGVEVRGHTHGDGESSKHAAANAHACKTTTKSSMTQRLTLQVGNTIDILLEAMSPEQREATKTYMDTTRALDEFVKSLRAAEKKEREEEREGEEKKEEETYSLSFSSSSQISMSTLWTPDGGVYRSLLRLYLNADLLSGTEVVDVLFPPHTSLTRDQFYFLLVVCTKSLVSKTLSHETARACGAFLRLMEEKILNNNNNNENGDTSSNDIPQVLTEKDALQLVDTALPAIDSVDAYTCLRNAYLMAPAPVKRYEKVEAKLLEPTPQQATTSSVHSSTQQQQQQHRGVVGVDGEQNVSHSGWKAEWTATMRNYPLVGDPFTPLPTGWTSSLSRTYGHYYFKNAEGTATYKHPTDDAQFMATPQAFLREPGVSITLMDVLARANNNNNNVNNASTGIDNCNGAKITEEQARRWLDDQRIRVEELDMSTLALLSITYRVGGGSEGAGQGSGHGNSKRSRRHPREHSESHNSHQSRKRARVTSCTAAELQRKLRKIINYPPRGHPFPPLMRGWTCNLSSSNGLYYFRPPRGNPVYQHPANRREYRASPQAFVLHRGIHANAIAAEANRDIEEVKKWMEDQRQRDEVLDMAVARMVCIEYAPSPDYESDEEHDDEDKRATDIQQQQEL